MRTILVGTDLTDRSRPAIARGAELVQASGGRLIVCHAVPRTLPINPLFPHESSEKLMVAAEVEQRVVSAVNRQVVDATGLSAFDVIVDIGDPPDVICAQAELRRADLVIVTADRPGVGAVARDLSTLRCSLLVLGTSTGDAAAIVILESELQAVASLVEAARAVVLRPVSNFVVIMWADSEERKAPVLAELDRKSRTLGVPLEPWFADLVGPSPLPRVASDPHIGLVALTAPEPDSIVGRRAGPLDDGVENARASFLLIRR